MNSEMRRTGATPTTIIGAQAACRLLGISRPTLTRRVAAGVIEPVGQLEGPNGALIFRRADIEAVARGEVTLTQEAAR